MTPSKAAASENTMEERARERAREWLKQNHGCAYGPTIRSLLADFATHELNRERLELAEEMEHKANVHRRFSDAEHQSVADMLAFEAVKLRQRAGK